VVPTSVGPHICLVARVSHPRDPVPINTTGNQSPDPGGERHWAQRNVVYIAPAPGGVIDFSFWAANPDEREREFTLQARPFASERLNHLTRTLRAEPIKVDATFDIRQAGDLLEVRARLKEGHPESTLRLRGGSRRAMQLRMKVSSGPAEGHCGAFEILQRRREDEHLVGGIALIVLPASNR
jgi:hypothetical protein